jgi:hypothetical protein
LAEREASSQSQSQLNLSDGDKIPNSPDSPRDKGSFINDINVSLYLTLISFFRFLTNQKTNARN